mmetsp:Transcript_8091/g.14347  ORF Transcript_8091/g.14347 Transcript_8091/m.14347 type:complete len:108 (-) Transcript_8091:264-587(-)
MEPVRPAAPLDPNGFRPHKRSITKRRDCPRFEASQFAKEEVTAPIASALTSRACQRNQKMSKVICFCERGVKGRRVQKSNPKLFSFEIDKLLLLGMIKRKAQRLCAG